MPGAHTSKVNDNMRRRHVKRAYAENLVNEFLDLRNEMGTELVDVFISEKSRRVPLEKVEKAIKSANSGIAEMKRLTAQVSTHEPTTRTKSTISAINSKAPQLQTQQHQTTPQPQVIDSLMKAEIKITADSTEEQVLQEFRVVMADFAEHRRQKTLEIANRAVCGVESNYKSSNWGTLKLGNPHA